MGKLALGVVAILVTLCQCDDMLRKSIVFDKATPKVFYCPQVKPTSFDKMIVKARPLEALCEYGGHGHLPERYHSDCYNDVDETEFACKEKKRIMMRLHPPNNTIHLTNNVIEK